MRAPLAAIFILCALAGSARASLLDAVEAFRKGDFAAAVAACRGPAEAGDASCQNFMGMVYETGKGVKADPAEAVRWFRKAAEQGHGYAANNLGYAYASGRGVGKDLAAAEKWFRVAAEQGIPDAELSVGLLLIGRKEGKEAVKWFRRAAAQGLPAAQSELGGAYENGE